MIPNYLIELLRKYYDQIDIDRIIDGFKEDKITSFRVNTLKATKEEIIAVLKENNIDYNLVSWYKDAFIINEDIRNLDIYKDGKIYMQSLSSMLPVLELEPNDMESILDMTAAPGGKTTQIAAISNNKTLITAIEKNKIRKDRLLYNINKMGAKKVTVLNEDARSLDSFYSFDKILLDAPCSGSGTIINNDFNNFNLELVNRSINTQKVLLEKAISLLKKGHIMIYSTCSILKEENENQLIPLIEKNIIEIVPIDISKYNIPLLPTKIDGVMCVCPSKEYEGFFVAKIKKL